MRAAVLSSASGGAPALFERIVNGADPVRPAALVGFLGDLAEIIGARNREPEVGSVLAEVSRATDAAQAIALARSLGEGLRRAGSALPTAQLGSLVRSACGLTADRLQPESRRAEAIQFLGLTSFADAGATLVSCLTSQEAQGVALAAVQALGRFSDPRVGAALLERCPRLSPRLRAEAVSMLTARAERAGPLLRAIADGQIRSTDLSSTQIEFLKNHRDPAVRAEANRLLGAASTGKRPDVYEAFKPALDLAGDAARGRALFVERCASCHRLGGEGSAVGPDLVSVRNNGKEKMLLNILEPSREILPQYLAYEIETRDGESLLGLVVNESAASVTVRQAYAKETLVLRSNVETLQSRGQSMMPEGLETGLTPQGMADLLEFVLTAER
jgi:putative heme-binding domain-containing protein